MSTEADIARFLSGTGPILLDFDGPVCRVFAGYPASRVAEELRATLLEKGVDLHGPIVSETDPLEVLRWTGRQCPQSVTQAVEDALRIAELTAVQSASPTPYAREFIIAARAAGKPVVIVSNNSADAIADYLARHRLTIHVAHIAGRFYGQPQRMKPHPDPVLRAIAAVDSTPNRCVLIGDSVSDVAVAKAVEIPIIAYAGSPLKRQRLAETGADIVIGDMGKLASALIKRGETPDK